MNTLIASAMLGSLGLGFFEVEPSATILDYEQTTTALAVTGTDFLGGTLGGNFTSSQNWQGATKLGIRASLAGTNPNAFFFVELYSGPSLDLVGVYEATTKTLIPGSPGDLELALLEAGPGTLSDIRGMQFTWAGEGAPVSLSMLSFVEMNPLSPEITFYGFLPAGFTIRWTGTGSRPVNVQRSTNLSSGVWETVATGVTTGEYSDPATPSSRAFYRVALP
jgi:hypothetical protein